MHNDKTNREVKKTGMLKKEKKVETNQRRD